MTPCPPRHALVVDDSSAMRRQLCRALQGAGGIRTTEAVDGADAWRHLAAARFDLLVTDINMPVLDGLKLVSLIRSGGAHRAMPILVVTTEAGEVDRRRALGLGANDYLVKPVQAHQVVEAVRRLLGAA
ncbi:response regulator receiver protein [Anaeromyxobacter dehalogenans 2CP-1]|uniref:Response regulator receiver protein n=1 Tax=Anaeromyxobacter dehalogenans (strain ATCC BAA-258 / DSM 21875 / 2CP-1) TaxID=455488 RepID=B8JEV4_ANAD2|nr:response regulator [Anaeromyxobacter dehalogenans]ACL66250.1 response regulator receiver protein [Anaeromyxobacter dehalogenans 2CP-1]